MELYSMKKKDNFIKTLRNLENAFNEYYPPKNDFERTGLISHFEICFEQCWKAVREKLLQDGIEKKKINSPRNVLKTAYQEDLIQDEKTWLDILDSRNLGVHIYDAEFARKFVEKIYENYLPALCMLGKNI